MVLWNLRHTYWLCSFDYLNHIYYNIKNARKVKIYLSFNFFFSLFDNDTLKSIHCKPFFFNVCVRAHARICKHECLPGCVCWGQRITCGSGFFLYQVGWRQNFRIGGRCLYLLSQVAGWVLNFIQPHKAIRLNEPAGTRGRMEDALVVSALTLLGVTSSTTGVCRPPPYPTGEREERQHSCFFFKLKNILF